MNIILKTNNTKTKGKIIALACSATLFIAVVTMMAAKADNTAATTQDSDFNKFSATSAANTSQIEWPIAAEAIAISGTN